MDRASVISVLEDTKRASERCLTFLSEDDASYYTFKERSEALNMAIAALREQEQSKWISVKERLPEEKGVYLVYVKTYNKWGGYTKVTWFTPCYKGVEDHLQGKQIWYDYDSEWGDYEVRDVTHWMPLPEPPEGGAQE